MRCQRQAGRRQGQQIGLVSRQRTGLQQCSVGGLDGGRRTRAACRVLGWDQSQKNPRDAGEDGGECPPLSPLVRRHEPERPGSDVTGVSGSAAAEIRLSVPGDQRPPPRPFGELTEPPLGRWGNSFCRGAVTPCQARAVGFTLPIPTGRVPVIGHVGRGACPR